MFVVSSYKSISQTLPDFTQEGFINEISQLFGKSKNKSDKLMLDKCIMAWNSGGYTLDQKESLIKISGILKSKKADRKSVV